MMQIPLITGILFATSGLCALLALYIFFSANTRKGYGLIGLFTASSLYTFGFAMEVASRDLVTATFWLRFEYFGIVLIPLTWLLFSREFSEKKVLLPKAALVPMLLFSFTSIILVWTNGSHHLFIHSMKFTRIDGIGILSYTNRGPLYWIIMAYLNLGILAGLLTIFRHVKNDHSIRFLQGLGVISASLLPWLSHLFYQLGMTPYGLDIAPFGITISGIIFLISIFKNRLVALQPVAHQTIFATIPDGALILDRNGCLVEYNAAAEQIFPSLTRTDKGTLLEKSPAGHPALLQILQTLRDTPINDLPESKQEDDKNLLTIQQDNASTEEVYHIRIRTLVDRRKVAAGSIILLTNITEQTRLLKELQELATMDGLTRIFNRRHFFTIAEKELSRSYRYQRPFCLIMFDIDHFKKINDTHGHQAGDCALRHIADLCKECLRTTDTIARYGGEEFILLLPETEEEQGFLVAERLRTSLEGAGCTYLGTQIRATSSFGIVSFSPDSNESLDTMINRVDRALYQAKKTGRNRVCRG